MVPEKYEFARPPEGVTLNESLTAELGTVARELKLSQDAAAKIYDLGIRQAQAMAASLQESHRQTHQQWLTQLQTDASVGGTKWAESQELVSSAENFFEGKVPGFKALLSQSGWRDNPLFFKALHAVGMAVRESRFIDGNANQPPKDKLAEMYPSMAKK